MKVKVSFEDDKSKIELIPETVSDQRLLDHAINTNTTAHVKRNGSTTFTLDMAKEALVAARPGSTSRNPGE